MSRYTNVKVNISQGQVDKIRRAAQTGEPVSIRLAHSDLSGEHVLALTTTQVNKIKKAQKSGKGVTIKMSKTQIMHNATKVEGGFIQALLPLLATAGRFLLSSLATGVGSAAINEISGNGVIYLKKKGMGCKVTAAGQGLYLSPWRKGSSVGEGTYIKSGSSYVDGKGLLLGENSPFKNIPLLGWIL